VRERCVYWFGTGIQLVLAPQPPSLDTLHLRLLPPALPVSQNLNALIFHILGPMWSTRNMIPEIRRDVVMLLSIQAHRGNPGFDI
jgi:hypothetical protein